MRASAARRPRSSTRSIVVGAALAAPDSGALAVESARAARALAQLGEGERQILLLGLVEGLTHAEIATETGKPLGTVKTQMRRGLIKIRALLGAEAPPVEDD